MQIADLDKDLAAILSNKEKVLAALNQLVGQESYVRAAIAKMKADEAAKPALPSRFLAFAGERFYPGGGWRDFRGAFDSLDEAKAATARPDDEWAQVVDSEAGDFHTRGYVGADWTIEAQTPAPEVAGSTD